ncbi:MAG: PH domain-containing protein [Pirellulaceae bacterium]|nr:PH domain-containing protein [Pirellulaceae bacterium]
MKQAIAGVTPASVQETTVTTVWPSICRYALGQCLGQAYSIRAGVWVLTAGNLIALASIPLALALYFLRVAPFVGVRYRLTNQRVIVARGIAGKTEERSLPLEKFDSLEIHVRSGQEWFDAGDLIFVRHEGNERIEAFRLEAVSRPRAFRQVCLKARQARVGVLRAQQRQTAVAS